MEATTRSGQTPDKRTEAQETLPPRSGLRRLFAKVVGERTVNRSNAEPVPTHIEIPAKLPTEVPAVLPSADLEVASVLAVQPDLEPVAAVSHVVELVAEQVETGVHLEALSREQLRFNRDAAAQEDVFADIHPDDFIYRMCSTHPMLTTHQGASYYFSDGAASARKIVDLVGTFSDLDPRSIDFLEFASGYGRVSRHLKKIPRIRLTCCDIHEHAIPFLDSELGLKAVLSETVPEALVMPQTYDVVFALSFFSHLPRSSFGRWIQALYETLSTPGYLVFTTHGIKSCAFQGITPADLPADGFWYRPTSEQYDLDPSEYGTSITTPDFVIGEIYRQTRAPIVEYRQGAWWGHEDLWVLKREA